MAHTAHERLENVGSMKHDDIFCHQAKHSLKFLEIGEFSCAFRKLLAGELHISTLGVKLDVCKPVELCFDDLFVEYFVNLLSGALIFLQQAPDCLGNTNFHENHHGFKL